MERGLTLSMVNRLASSMEKELASLEASPPTNYMFKIPGYIRKANEQAYRPLAISIGPIHYGDSALETIQCAKWILMRYFLQHPRNAHRNNVNHFIDVVSEGENEIRQCYKKELTSDINIPDFIQMVLLDATFIISVSLMLDNNNEDNNNVDKPEVTGDILALIENVTVDLFMMENQLPFFILLDLFNTAFPNSNFSFPELVWNLMRYTHFFILMSDRENIIREIIMPSVSDPRSSIKHLLHLYWLCCLHDVKCHSPDRNISSNGNLTPIISCLTIKELEAGGVRIVASKSKNLLEIEYKEGSLEIPKIYVDDTTETIFRNMLYFEQCNAVPDKYITDYLLFLNSLIDTEEDVQILVEKGILVSNWLGHNAAFANLINCILVNATVSTGYEYYYSDVARELNTFAKRPWNRWKTILRRQYFRQPWTAISFFGAIILFILTVLQTISGFNK